jgi:cbb3-type cytochrome oxidase subunit 3
MCALIRVCLADFAAIKGIAVLALVLVAYLYWANLREKRERRRERQWLEDRRRALKENADNKSSPPTRL